MAVNLKEIYLKTKQKYKLQLVAGKSGLDCMMNWVYRMESLEDIKFLKGNELIITTGFVFKEETEFLKLIKALKDKGCCGLILNIGMYIEETPDKVREYCNACDLPLFEMPWAIPIMEISREYYKYIYQSECISQELSEAFHVILGHPDMVITYKHILEANGFLVKQHYYCVLVHICKGIQGLGAGRLNEMLQQEMKKHKVTNNSYIIKYEDDYLVIFENEPSLSIKEIMQIMVSRLQQEDSKLEVYCGIGSEAKGLQALAKSLKDARAALQKGIYFEEVLTAFEEMGIYQILLSVTDEAVLKGYYEKYLGELVEYDALHQSDFMETLRLYLKYDGAVSRVAKELFMHRNTVNHRISRIKEILGDPLANSESYFNYQMAMYIYDLYALRKEKIE